MPDNMLPEETMTDAEFRRKITDYFLGKDYYITMSMSQNQANVIIYNDIVNEYKTHSWQSRKPKTKLGSASAPANVNINNSNTVRNVNKNDTNVSIVKNSLI